MTAPPFDPRTAIDERGDVVLVFDPVAGLMGGGLHARRGRLGVIVVDPRLEGAERREVLTHELVHHERDGSMPADIDADADVPVGLALLRDREERAVDEEVARRLVPTDQLTALVHRSSDDHHGIGPHEVAEHFDVPVRVARRALEGLVQRHGG